MLFIEYRGLNRPEPDAIPPLSPCKVNPALHQDGLRLTKARLDRTKKSELQTKQSTQTQKGIIRKDGNIKGESNKTLPFLLANSKFHAVRIQPFLRLSCQFLLSFVRLMRCFLSLLLLQPPIHSKTLIVPPSVRCVHFVYTYHRHGYTHSSRSVKLLIPVLTP